MDSSKYLIIGSSGQLGKALVKRFPDASAVDQNTLNITNYSALLKYDWSGVKVILNAAAYTDVDGSESIMGREVAWRVNAVGPANLAKIATKQNITLIHISSEYVFDGTNSLHDEAEPFTPLGVYAQSKAAGDIAVSTTPQHYIIRVSWLIGEGKNFVRTMAGLAEKNISPKVVNDQIGRLTFTTTLADGISHLLNIKAEYGTYNLSNEGQPASWAEITTAIFNKLGRNDLVVTGISTAEYFKDKPEAAPRPLKSTLNLEKITSTGLKIPDWEEELVDYLKKGILVR